MSSTRVTCCPLCFAPFPTSVIAAHASNCTGEKRSCRKKQKTPEKKGKKTASKLPVTEAEADAANDETEEEETKKDEENENKPFKKRYVSDSESENDENDGNDEEDVRKNSGSDEPEPSTSFKFSGTTKKTTKKKPVSKKTDIFSKAARQQNKQKALAAVASASTAKKPRLYASPKYKDSPSPSLSPTPSPPESPKYKKTTVTAPIFSMKKNTPPGRPPLPPINESHIPLAEEMRPKYLKEFIGQEQVLGQDQFFRSVLDKKTGNIPNMIFWGPPGCGKTSLANIIAQKCKDGDIKAKFVKLSACVAGISDVREVVTKAKNEWSMVKRKTILFMDEIHRFNKIQQDAFLPHVENGTITLIGATTENPTFSLNGPLLSRCRVLVLNKLSYQEVRSILEKAAAKRGFVVGEHITEDAMIYLATTADGDARTAINSLQLAMDTLVGQSPRGGSEGGGSGSHHSGIKANKNKTNGSNSKTIDVDEIKECLKKSHISGYDRRGDDHYHCASALQKSIRVSDDNAALYWTMRMLHGGEDPLYIGRRLVRIASEDVGLADTQALPLAVSAMKAAQMIGVPECNVVLAETAVYLARAPKSTEVYSAMSACLGDLEKGNLPGVPLHLRNPTSKLDESLGYGKGYSYDDQSMNKDLSFMPEGMEKVSYFKSIKKSK